MYTREQSRFVNVLAVGGTVSLSRKDLKAILLETSGRMFLRGCFYTLNNKHLGAGVYRCWMTKE